MVCDENSQKGVELHHNQEVNWVLQEDEAGEEEVRLEEIPLLSYFEGEQTFKCYRSFSYPFVFTHVQLFF